MLSVRNLIFSSVAENSLTQIAFENSKSLVRTIKKQSDCEITKAISIRRIENINIFALLYFSNSNVVTSVIREVLEIVKDFNNNEAEHALGVGLMKMKCENYTGKKYIDVKDIENLHEITGLAFDGTDQAVTKIIKEKCIEYLDKYELLVKERDELMNEMNSTTYYLGNGQTHSVGEMLGLENGNETKIVCTHNNIGGGQLTVRKKYIKNIRENFLEKITIYEEQINDITRKVKSLEKIVDSLFVCLCYLFPDQCSQVVRRMNQEGIKAFVNALHIENQVV